MPSAGVFALQLGMKPAQPLSDPSNTPAASNLDVRLMMVLLWNGMRAGKPVHPCSRENIVLISPLDRFSISQRRVCRGAPDTGARRGRELA